MTPNHELKLLGIDPPCARRVLIVDDQSPNLDVLEAMLEDDYDIVRADSGPAALRILEDDAEIDLIISDQRMPEMTGLEFLRESAARFPRVVRMVLTAYADVPPIVDAIESGVARMFLLKPWEPVALAAAVSECLEYKQGAGRQPLCCRSRSTSAAASSGKRSRHSSRPMRRSQQGSAWP